MSSSERAQLQDIPTPRTRTGAITMEDPHHTKKPTSRPTSSHTKPPVIVHVNPPKVFHTTPHDFMGLVQLLTGNERSGSLSRSCTPNFFGSSQGADVRCDEVCNGTEPKKEDGEDDVDPDPLLLSLGQLPPMPSVPASGPPGCLYSPNEYSFL